MKLSWLTKRQQGRIRVGRGAPIWVGVAFEMSHSQSQVVSGNSGPLKVELWLFRRRQSNWILQIRKSKKSIVHLGLDDVLANKLRNNSCTVQETKTKTKKHVWTKCNRNPSDVRLPSVAIDDSANFSFTRSLHNCSRFCFTATEPVGFANSYDK